MPDLRQQCEREIKSKLIGLRQAYISSVGDRRMLTERFVSSMAGFMPLFRGIILLMGKERPIREDHVLSELAASTGVNTAIFRRLQDMKKKKLTLSKDEMNTVFEQYYEETEKIGNIIDELRF